MASIFRSEEMTLCQLFLSNESCFNSLSILGEIGLVQFKNLNSHQNSFQQQFVNEIRRCEEMERKLKFFEGQIFKEEIKIFDDRENPMAPQPKQIIDLEMTFEKLDNGLKEVNSYMKNLLKNFTELTELKYVLETVDHFCGGYDLDPSSSMSQNLISTEEAKGSMDLGFITGCIKRTKMPMLEQLLWRVCRGNAFMRSLAIQKPLEDPETGDSVDKVSFIVFFQGESMRYRINKICEGCKARVFECPDKDEDRKKMLTGVQNRIGDLSVVMNHTVEHKRILLEKIAKTLRVWLIKVRKLKGIYVTMNKFSHDVTTKYFVAEAWIPTSDINTINKALLKATVMSGSAVMPIVTKLETTEMPPTLHKLNKFTKAFQKLIDSYGVATYREINPGLFTTTTFPFLFAVMFGDCGHGIILLLFALWMVLNEKKLATKNYGEIWGMFFGGRYIIMMMGMFSIYTGAVYNDMFSKSLSVFSSKFHVGTLASDSIYINHEQEYMLDPGNLEDFDGESYPFGIDPIWQLSLNKINYLNSYKMKISIIIGVLHMLFGISLSLVNYIHFKKYINILFDFLPQTIFLSFLFGYLCLLTIYKWFAFGAGEDFGFNFQHDTRCAPSILILFIDMFLFKMEEVPAQKYNETICDSMYLYPSEYSLQKYLVVIAVLMIPMMLFPKPYILSRREKKAKKIEIEMREIKTTNIDNDQPSTSSKVDTMPEKTIALEAPIKKAAAATAAEEEPSELFLHQGIHTIEFTLGCVSHTASYLRLWALSLAHAQLSEVLWMMVMAIGLRQSSTTGSIILYFIFAAWASLTIAILVVMEGLSAFLHTLRLHWVEFCSKFYEREGYLFHPFKFKHFINETEE